MYKRVINFLELITTFGGHHSEAKSRFLRYSIVGCSTTVLDFLFLFILVEYTQTYYLLAASFSFVLSGLLAYQINRSWGFKKTNSKLFKGGFSYLSINALGLILVILLMALFVEILSLNYLVARTFSGILIGMQSFILNTKVTFKMNVFKN